ncbi:hypothetical protein A2U01_0047407, partial [Trifolium medium]|nr:hypothetical protein [Trifolium medium]
MSLVAVVTKPKALFGSVVCDGIEWNRV